MTKKIHFLVLTILTISSLGLVACETVEGAGRDLETAGENVQDAAN